MQSSNQLGNSKRKNNFSSFILNPICVGNWKRDNWVSNDIYMLIKRKILKGRFKPYSLCVVACKSKTKENIPRTVHAWYHLRKVFQFINISLFFHHWGNGFDTFAKKAYIIYSVVRKIEQQEKRPTLFYFYSGLRKRNCTYRNPPLETK